MGGMFQLALAVLKHELSRKPLDPMRLYQAVRAVRDEAALLQHRGVDPSPLVDPLVDAALTRLSP